MSFQFINTTADNRKPDEKTRKQIRSQVMKDYRRRKDEESGESSFAGRASSSFQPRLDLPRTSIPSTPPPNEVLGERSSKRGRPNKSQQEQAASLFLQTAHGLFSNFTIKLGNTRPISTAVILQDNREIPRMMSICERFNQWLQPERTAIAGLFSRHDSLHVDDMLRLYAVSMMSIGHLSAIGIYDGDEERAYYKSKLLQMANQSLQDPSKAMSDSTLAALACLTSYEISFDSYEALTHLNGISRIIEWRGGVSRVGGRSGLPIFLQILDLLHAVYFHVEPVYSRVQRRRQDEEESEDAADIAHDWQDFIREAASFLRDQDNLQASRACFLAWRIHLFQPQQQEEWSKESVQEMRELYQLMSSVNPDRWKAYPALQVRVLLTALATSINKRHKAWYYSHLSHLMIHTEARHWNDLKSLVNTFINAQAYYRRPDSRTVKAMVSGVEIVIERTLAAQLGLQTIDD